MDVYNSIGRYRCWDIVKQKERHQISLYDIIIYGKKIFYYGEKNVKHQKWQQEEDNGSNKKMEIFHKREEIKLWHLYRQKERG